MRKKTNTISRDELTGTVGRFLLGFEWFWGDDDLVALVF